MGTEPDAAAHTVADLNRADRERKAAYVAHLRAIGDALDATPRAIMITPPGVAFAPVVYQRRDGSALLLVGKRGEVAGTQDAPERRAGARYRVDGITQIVGSYVVTAYSAADLQQDLQQGQGFYALQGYPELRPYNRESDPPLLIPPTS